MSLKYEPSSEPHLLSALEEIQNVLGAIFQTADWVHQSTLIRSTNRRQEGALIDMNRR